MPPARGLLHQLTTDRRVRADLADTSLPAQLICPTAFRRAAGLWLKTKPASGHAVRKIRTVVASNITLSEKSSGNDKYGTGSLVTREGAAALERGRRRLYKLVRAHGPGKRPAGKRPPFGSDAVSQELDPGALRRTRSHLLAGRDAGSAPDRPHRAHGNALRGAGKGIAGAGRSAAPRTVRWPSRAGAARNRDRAGVREPRRPRRLAARS